MKSFRCFEEIEGWKKARELTRKVYSVSGKGHFNADYGLRDQMRRAAVSVMSNIAEGAERGGSGEFLQFLSMAKGSTGEVRAQLHVALDQGYIDGKDFDRLTSLAEETAKLIAGLMNYLRKTTIRGSKYKTPTDGLPHADSPEESRREP
jgi:four helix bundle protein